MVRSALLLIISIACSLGGGCSSDHQAMEQKELEEIFSNNGEVKLSETRTQYISTLVQSRNKEEFYKKANAIYFDGTSGASIADLLFFRLYLADATDPEIGQILQKNTPREVIAALDKKMVQELSVPANLFVIITFSGFGLLPFEKSEIMAEVTIKDQNDSLIVEDKDILVKAKEFLPRELLVNFARRVPVFQFPANLPAGSYSCTVEISSPTAAKPLKLVHSFTVKSKSS